MPNGLFRYLAARMIHMVLVHGLVGNGPHHCIILPHLTRLDCFVHPYVRPFHNHKLHMVDASLYVSLEHIVGLKVVENNTGQDIILEKTCAIQYCSSNLNFELILMHACENESVRVV